MNSERFAGGRACPICGSIHVVRNGHRANGAQKYMCRDCKKSFVVATNSIVSGTQKDLSVWEQYISCMINGLSIRKTAEVCGIHRNTAFYWRHKILDALQNMADNVNLDGIVEMDETFFNVSYKGSRKMPRVAHRRGGEIHKSGMSVDKVCVPCAVNRSGLSIAKVANWGRLSCTDVCKIYTGRIDSGAIMVTDKMNSYIRFAKENNIQLIQLETNLTRKGIYNVQRINNYHNLLKRFMRKFNGVATKYLNNYLIWNNFINYSKETIAENIGY